MRQVRVLMKLLPAGNWKGPTVNWKRILLVVDASWVDTRAVLHKVAQFASGPHAEIEVFESVFDPALSDCRKVHEAMERRRAELEPIAQALRTGSTHAHVAVRWAFPPREGILQQVRFFRPDLVILRSKRHSTLARLLFTYSDYKLIETVACPILVIKNDRPYQDARVIAAIDPMHAHDKPAQLDERILDAGASIAAATGLPLHVYHACASLPPELPSLRHLRDIPAGVYEDFCGAWYAKVQARVRQLAATAHVPESRVHVEMGDAAELLSQFIQRDSGDVLVMGAVSRSCIRKALIGYTAERVLDATECDVLIVKPPRAARSATPAERMAGRPGALENA
jgi:universal stress protein E